MEDKIVLRNPQKFDIGIITLEKPLGVNIRAGSFALVNESELNYLASTCDLLQKGMLLVDDKHKEQMLELGINPDEDVNFVTNEEIQKTLNMLSGECGCGSCGGDCGGGCGDGCGEGCGGCH